MPDTECDSVSRKVHAASYCPDNARLNFIHTRQLKKISRGRQRERSPFSRRSYTNSWIVLGCCPNKNIAHATISTKSIKGF